MSDESSHHLPGEVVGGLITHYSVLLPGVNAMANYILRRVLYMVVTIFFISIIGFALIQLPPGSALNAKIERLRAQGGELSGDQIKSLEERYGLNDPVQVKYLKWATGALHGDFGQSFTYDAPVNDLIWSRIGFSVLLSLFS